MPIEYWDPTYGGGGNNGDWATPWTTFDNASTNAGAGGETRLKGAAKTTLAGTATITNGSTSVVFTNSQAGVLAAGGGDWLFFAGLIGPDGEEIGTWFRTVSYTDGTKTAVLLRIPYFPTQAGVTVYLAGGVVTLSASMTTQAANQTHSVGWTADGVQGGMNVIVQDGARSNLVVAHSGLLDVSVGELCLGHVSGLSTGSTGIFCATANVAFRVKGTLYVAHGTSTSYAVIASIYNTIEFFLDEVRAAHGASYCVVASYGRIVVRRVVVSTNAASTGTSFSASADAQGVCGVLLTYGGGSTRHLSAVTGHVWIGAAYLRGQNAAYPPTVVAGGGLWIGSLSSLTQAGADNPLTPTGNCEVGNPPGHAQVPWILSQNAGVVQKASGNKAGASGSSYKLNPGSPYLAVHVPLKRPLASGATLTVKFYAVYTGTAGDAPPCFVRALDPNGLTVADTAFTPNRSANTPGGVPDGWADASQHSIALGGTAAGNASVVIGIWCRDNAAGDAVLYVSEDAASPGILVAS
jgi:hypothetical protein